MTNLVLTLTELEQKPLLEILRQVLKDGLILTIQLPEGDEVIIQPKQSLQPLPLLEGYVPDG